MTGARFAAAMPRASAAPPTDPTGAVSSVLGTALLCGCAVALAAALGIAGSQLVASVPAAIDSGAVADFTNGAFRLATTGPEPIPLAGGELVAIVDGAEHRWPLAELAPQLARGDAWVPGASACIVGPPPCLLSEGNDVSVTVYAQDSLVFRLPGVTYRPSFAIEEDGGIRLLCSTPVVAQVLGSQYQSGGQMVPVFADVTADRGASWRPVGGGSQVVAGQVQDLGLVDQDAVLGVRGIWWPSGVGVGQSAGHTSFDSSRHVEVLRDGDAAPAYAPFANQVSLASFLQPYVRNGQMELGPGEAVALFELATMAAEGEPALATTDFNDLVVLFRLANPVCELDDG